MLIAFRAILRPCKIAARYLSRWPLPSSVLQSQLGLLLGVASSAHHWRFAVHSGAISLNHFLTSVRILCLCQFNISVEENNNRLQEADGSAHMRPELEAVVAL